MPLKRAWPGCDRKPRPEWNDAVATFDAAASSQDRQAAQAQLTFLLGRDGELDRPRPRERRRARRGPRRPAEDRLDLGRRRPRRSCSSAQSRAALRAMTCTRRTARLRQCVSPISPGSSPTCSSIRRASARLHRHRSVTVSATRSGGAARRRRCAAELVAAQAREPAPVPRRRSRRPGRIRAAAVAAAAEARRRRSASSTLDGQDHARRHRYRAATMSADGGTLAWLTRDGNTIAC